MGRIARATVPPLHLGVILPNYGAALAAEELANVAVAAEAAGFHSAWVTDHLMVPDEYAGVYGTIAEALVSLGFLAARTQRLELGVSALVVPQRNPLVALKQLTTLDFLSGGRIVTAVAAGWMEREFATLGAGFEGRGRLLDEWLELASRSFSRCPGVSATRGARCPSTAGWRRGSFGWRPRALGRRRLACDAAARGAHGVWHPVALPPDEVESMAADLRERRPDCRVVLRIGVYFEREPGSVTTSAAGTRSPVLRSGWRGGSASTSRRAPTGSSSTSITASLASRTEVGRFAEEVIPLLRR